MSQTPAVCLQDKTKTEVKCADCRQGCALYNALAAERAAELEDLVGEISSQGKRSSFVIFIK